MTAVKENFVYSHWSKVPKEGWRWPNFTPQELASKGGGEVMINFAAMDKLQALRTLVYAKYGVGIQITSAYRTPEWNKRQGGASNSYHMKAMAFDCSMANRDPEEFIRLAKKVGFIGIGTYPEQNFIHIDIGPQRQWGAKFAHTFGTGGTAPEPVKPKDTEKAVAVGGASTVVTGVTAVAALDGPAQLIVIAGAVLAGLVLLYLLRNKLRRYLDG